MTKFSTDFHSLLADLVGAQNVAVVTGILENIEYPASALRVVLRYLDEVDTPHTFYGVCSLEAESSGTGFYVEIDYLHTPTLVYDATLGMYLIHTLASYRED